MTGGSNTKKGLVENAKLVTRFVVLAAIAFFFLSFMHTAMHTAFSQGRTQGGGSETLKGDVVAVDNLHNVKMLTLRSGEIGKFPNNSLNIFLNRDTRVKICNAREPVKDINVDRKATVIYHEVRGLRPLASSVSEPC
jgi:hypothetical protein